MTTEWVWLHLPASKGRICWLHFHSVGGSGTNAAIFVWVTAVSESAPNAELSLSGLFDLQVDESNLLLGQRSLHVAVDDAVTLTPPIGPEGREERREGD